jgi:peroxiredoxin
LLLSAVVVVTSMAFLESCSGRPAADFTLMSNEGTSFTMSESKGKNGVMLMFFASWCSACAEQVPQVKELVESSNGSNVAVYGVSIQEENEAISKFIEAKQVNYPILLDTDTAVAAAYEVKGIPTFIGIDINGKIVYRGHSLPEDQSALLKKLAGA